MHYASDQALDRPEGAQHESTCCQSAWQAPHITNSCTDTEDSQRGFCRELQGSRSGLTSIGNLPVCTDYVLMHRPSHVLDSFVTANTSKHSPQAPTVVAVTEEKIWVTGRDSKSRGGSASRAASLSLSVNAWDPTNAAG